VTYKSVVISASFAFIALISFSMYERYYYSTHAECVLKTVARHGINSKLAYRLASKHCKEISIKLTRVDPEDIDWTGTGLYNDSSN